MTIQPQKWITSIASMFLTLLLCFSVPLTFASDRDIYTSSTKGNITIMLTMDQSLSMTYDTWGVTACDIPDGYLDYEYGSTFKDDFDNHYKALTHPNVTFNYKRSYCIAKPPIIKHRGIYNAAKQFVYQTCLRNKDLTKTGPVYNYDDCEWSQTTNTTTKPAGGAFSYLLPGTTGFKVVYVYFDKSDIREKLYDRMTRVKDGIYEVLYRPKDAGSSDSLIAKDISIGLAVFPVNAANILKGSVVVPARQLGDTVGTMDQRATLMTAISNMAGVGVTPTLNAYADVAAYLMGTNTLLKPLSKVKAAQRIEWKACYQGLDYNRTRDGKCTYWYENNLWIRSNLPTTYFDVNSITEVPITECTGSIPSNINNDMNELSNCYATKRMQVRYVAAIPDAGSGINNAVWRTCNTWRENGLCRGYGDWDNTKQSDGITTPISDEWNKTKPNDPRLILNLNDSSLTDDQKKASYDRVSYSAYQCPTDGVIAGGGVVDSSYRIVCFAEMVNMPVFAVKKIKRAATTKDQGSPNGVWKECTGGYNDDGSCKKFTPEPASIYDGSDVLKTDNLLTNNYDYWSNAKPSSVNESTDIQGFCSDIDYDSAPGNRTGATAICYYNEENDVYQQHGYSSYAGFEQSVTASKTTNSDILRQRYQRPAAVQAQLDTPNSCGGQGIYILTDGEANSSGTDIARVLYKSALLRRSRPTASRNFSCASPEFGISNDMWGCVSNFAKTIREATTNPIGLSIKTATVGFGEDYANLPLYDKKLSRTENAAAIQDYVGSNDIIKNMALLGVYGQGGWYRGANASDVAASILNFLDSFAQEIPPLNTGVVTIPVSSLNPIEIQSDAYYPEFAPKPNSIFPLWFGNVKKFKVADGVLKDANGDKVMDALGNPRLKNSTDGTLRLFAKDYWNSAGDDIGGALSKIPLRFVTTDTGSKNLVKRNIFINQELVNGDTVPTAGDKPLFKVYQNDEYLSSADPNKGYLLGLLGYQITEAQAKDTASLDTTALDQTSVLRQMGAATHSTPILLTQSGRVEFDADGQTVIKDANDYIAFGTSQGLLQVVDAATGKEKFAFLPYEMITKQKIGFLKSQLISGTTPVENIFHGIDAPWTNYSEYVPTGTSGTLTVGSGLSGAKGKQWLYGGLRMGGRSYYALDVSELDKYDSTFAPKLKFHINPDAAATGSPLSFMGQSWSKPTVTYVNWKGQRKLVMFVGGGYDVDYEDNSYNQTLGKGAGVYMFDANNGDLLWWASSNVAATTDTALKVPNMKYSVVSRINTLDRNADGAADHLYFGDLGGQLWRIDLKNAFDTNITDAVKNKAAIRLANFNSVVDNKGYSPRFYEAPNLSVYEESGKDRFVAVAIGSGNRSSPIGVFGLGSANRTNDKVFVVFDKDVGSPDLYKSAYVYKAKDLTLSNLLENTNKVSGTAASYSNAGWYYNLVSTYIQSAKVLGETVSFNKSLYVPVYDASQNGQSGACGSGIKGTTSISRFCLPYGKCTDTLDGQSNELYVGTGMLGVNVGRGSTSSSMQIVGGNCTGQSCTGSAGGDPTTVLVKKEQTVIRKIYPAKWFELSAKE